MRAEVVLPQRKGMDPSARCPILLGGIVIGNHQSGGGWGWWGRWVSATILVRLQPSSRSYDCRLVLLLPSPLPLQAGHCHCRCLAHLSAALVISIFSRGSWRERPQGRRHGCWQIGHGAHSDHTPPTMSMTPTDERGPKTPKDHATRSTRLTTVEAVKCYMMARFTHYFQRTIQHPRTILNDSRLNWKQEGLRLIKSPRRSYCAFFCVND